jgi:non-hemolytic enterotoxin B/C
MPDVSGNAKKIGDANTNQMSAALIVQTYANSVLQQPQVDFSKIDGLKVYQDQINTGLTTAQGHATNYLNVLQPQLIQNMGDIDNYYQLNKALPATLPAGSSVDQWTQLLQTVLDQSTTYRTSVQKTVTDLQAFRGQLQTDSRSFATTVTNLNSAVNGDNGVLSQINEELGQLQSTIDGAIAGIVASSLTIAGGVFVICVGAIADFVTAGTSTGAVIGGVGMVAAGVGGDAASITALVTANESKAKLLSQESRLKDEVKLASAVSAGYTTLAGKLDGAITAANAIINAWTNIATDLTGIISDLKSGVLSTDALRTLFVTAANGEIATLLQDIQTVKGQMAGVTVQVAAKNQTVSQVIQAAANDAVQRAA